jgi:hypothetical protein
MESKSLTVLVEVRIVGLICRVHIKVLGVIFLEIESE